jgi:DeoR/GlpR family transcriptional regulator of sugar metabolism
MAKHATANTPGNGIGNKVLTEQRRLLIANAVAENGSVAAEELGTRFGVSHMTIYRDLKALENQGHLRFVRGGAVRGPAVGSENATVNEPLYFAKRQLQKEQKELIARYAAEQFVTDNDFIILEAGTTVAALVKHLRHKHLTVMTNGLETVNEAAPLLPDLTVMCCGGILREVSHTFVGPQAEQFFRDVRGKTLFLGASGLTVPGGVTDPNPLEIQVKRAMAQSVDRVVLLIDSSKFGQRSLAMLLPFERLDVIVTDQGAPESDVKQLRALGVDVRIAPG